jgi:putative DNA primase/helicase
VRTAEHSADSHQDVATSVAGVLPHHLRELRASGLTDGTIRAAGIHSETDCNRLAAMLGWKKYAKSMGAAIVYQYRDDQGRNGYARIKPDRPRSIGGKPVKYESPKGQPNQVYLPPGVVDVLPDPARELLITEGEKKSLSATQAGFPCIGLVGVYGFAPKGKMTLCAELERVAWRGRPVYIVFDSDIGSKPDVQEAEGRLAAHLTSRGARVRVVRLPDGEPGPDGKPVKVGLDDFIVQQGQNALRALRSLLNAAIEPSPPEPGSTRQDARHIDPATEAARYLEAGKRDGVYRLRFQRGDFLLWRGGAYREVHLSEVRADIVRHLNQGYRAVTMTATANVLDQVKAQSILSGDVRQPAWIGPEPGPWPAEEVLPAANGLVHLPTFASGGEYLRPKTPRFFSTMALDYAFDAEAPSPATWVGFLDQLWRNDTESIATLQDWFGYCLTGDTRQQKILMLVGPKRSGKGTIGRTLRAMIGPENVAGPTLASLGTNFGLWPLLAKSLAIISDARLSGRTDSSIVVERLLSISGEDALTIDRKCLQPVTCKLPTRLMILSNELPRMGDASGALASRMIVLRMTESFHGREDPTLGDKLQGELPGILLWAVDGWKRLRDRGRFVQPASGVELAEEMESLSSPTADFVRERCIVGAAYDARVADLYREYQRWSARHGREHLEDERGFGRNLRAAVPSIERKQRRVGGCQVWYYQGIGLRLSPIVTSDNP